MALLIDDYGTVYRPSAAEQRAAQLARERAAAQAATDAAAAAAKPTGDKFRRRPTEANRNEVTTAYAPVYENVVYELELAVDAGVDLDAEAQRIKQRNGNDPVLDFVVDLAVKKVRGESDAARHTNETRHEGRAELDQALAARDAATHAIETTPRWPGMGPDYDQYIDSQEDIIEQSNEVIDRYVSDVTVALGAEIDAEARELAKANGRSTPNTEDYLTARTNVTQKHGDPMFDSIADQALSNQPGFATAVTGLDPLLTPKHSESPIRVRARPYMGNAAITTADYMQAAQNIGNQMPQSRQLIDQRARFLAGQGDLTDIRANGGNPTLPPGFEQLPSGHVGGMEELARNDPVAFWALQQAAAHGVVFDPFNLNLTQLFPESRDGTTEKEYRIGTDAQGNALWAKGSELRELAIAKPDKFALFVLGAMPQTTQGVTGQQAVQQIMSTQVLLRYEDTSTRATEQFELGQDAWERGDRDAAMDHWHEALNIIATNQRQAHTADEARMPRRHQQRAVHVHVDAGDDGRGDFGQLARTQRESRSLGPVHQRAHAQSGSPARVRQQGARCLPCPLRPELDRQRWHDVKGNDFFKALSRLTQVTGRANEFANLLTDDVYLPIFRYMHMEEYEGMRAAVADPEGVSPQGDSALALAYVNHRDSFGFDPDDDGSHAQGIRDWVRGAVEQAQEEAPGAFGQNAAQNQMGPQLENFNRNSGEALHDYFGTFQDPARLPDGFTIDGPQTVHTGNQLTNFVGWGLGMPGVHDFSLLDGNDTEESWYNPTQQNAMKDLLDAIRSRTGGSDYVTIQAVPFVYVDNANGQYAETALFVITVDGKQTIIDSTGAAYESYEAFYERNSFSDSGRIYLLQENQPEILRAVDEAAKTYSRRWMIRRGGRGSQALRARSPTRHSNGRTATRRRSTPRTSMARSNHAARTCTRISRSSRKTSRKPALRSPRWACGMSGFAYTWTSMTPSWSRRWSQASSPFR